MVASAKGVRLECPNPACGSIITVSEMEYDEGGVRCWDCDTDLYDVSGEGVTMYEEADGDDE